MDNNFSSIESENKEESLSSKQIILFKKVSMVDKYNFFEYLAVMIDGGVSITEALDSVENKISSPYFKEKVKELITYISSGDSFSKSMKKMPDVFTASEISIVEAGETTGKLVFALSKLSDDLKKIYNLRKKVKGALTYPLIIFLFLLAAVGIVLIYVIPAIIPMFENASVELPMATKSLIATSDFVINNFAFIVLFFITLFVLFVWYRNTESGRMSLDVFALKMPLVGKVYRNFLLASISSTLGSLIGAGVTVVKTLTLTGRSTNNAAYMYLFDEIVTHVSKGDKIVESMRDVDPEKYYFPVDYVQMLSVGEKTASLEKISEKLNDQYEKEVEYALASLTKWIEPLAILVAAIFVSWFAFAIFGAILKVTQTIG